MSNEVNELFEFGSYQLNARERLLRHNGKAIPLPPKAFETLLVLVRNNGRLVPKEELMRTIWPDSFVEEGNLTLNISILRKALQDDPDQQRFIETVPKHGYRFAEGVRNIPVGISQIIIEKHTFEHGVVEEDTFSCESTLERTRSWLHRWDFGSRRALRLSIAVTVVAVTVVALVAVQYSRRSGSLDKSHRTFHSIAVLPFGDGGSDADTEHLRLGIANAFITRLGNIHQLEVRPTSSVQKYFGKSVDVAMAGRELNVDAVLEGSVQRVGDRIRVAVQLIDVRDGVLIWTSSYDDQFTNVFAVEDSISTQAANALSLKLTAAEQQRLTKHGTENAEAYQLYLRGRFLWDLRDKNLGVSYFQKAIALDPSFALAYVGYADTQTFSPYTSGKWLKSEEAAKKAIELDPSLAEPHATLGFINMFHRWDWKAAESEFQQALALNPGYATAHHWYALCLAAEGRIGEAKSEINRAMQLEPDSSVISADVAQILYYARDYDSAIEQCQKTRALGDPGGTRCYGVLYHVYLKQGRYEEAFDATFKARKGLRPQVLEDEMNKYHSVGMRRFLLSEVKGLLDYPDSWNLLAEKEMLLGNKTDTLHWLGKAIDAHNFFMVFIKADPIFDELRSDPTYAELQRRVGLGE